MSRFWLPPNDDYEGYHLCVGYDCNNRTFFAQVANRNEDKEPENSAYLWLPLDPDRISDPMQIIDAMKPYAIIPEWLLPELKADQARHQPGHIHR